MSDGQKPGVASSVFDVEPKNTLFYKFASGAIKPDIVYEDESVLAFNDISPQAPTHILVIPKKLVIGRVQYASDEDATELGKLLVAAGKIAKQLNLEEGYRLVVNQGTQAQQSINYLHVHLMAGRQFRWPPG